MGIPCPERGRLYGSIETEHGRNLSVWYDFGPLSLAALRAETVLGRSRASPNMTSLEQKICVRGPLAGQVLRFSLSAIRPWCLVIFGSKTCVSRGVARAGAGREKKRP